MNPQQQNTSGSSGFVMIIIAVVGALIAAWYFKPELFIEPVMWLRLGELHLIYGVMSAWAALVDALGLGPVDLSSLDKLHQLIVLTMAAPKAASFNQFAQINSIVGDWMRYPIALILLAMAMGIYFLSKTSRYKITYTMDMLKREEMKNWPQVAPTVNLDLVKTGLEEGPWAMAKSPLMFCQDHQLVYPKRVSDYHVWSLHKAPAYRILSLQLGRQVRNLGSLPIHIKALLVVFVARATRKRELSDLYLKQIAASASSGQLDFSGVEKEFSELKNAKPLKWVVSRHAYVYTMTATMLEIARSDGVLASAEFLWLKPVDRRLWFMLSSVGRQTAFVEVAGAFSHWLAEKHLGRALKTPMVKTAVNALEEAMQGILYEEDGGHSWRSNGD